MSGRYITTVQKCITNALRPMGTIHLTTTLVNSVLTFKINGRRNSSGFSSVLLHQLSWQ